MCTVKVNGKPINACTMVVGGGMVIENDTAELNDLRKSIIEMLFVEGNHICPGCEKSGNCELQALAYRFGMMVAALPLPVPRQAGGRFAPQRLHRPQPLHPVRALRALLARDRPQERVRLRGPGHPDSAWRWTPGGRSRETDLAAADKAASFCPTGSLVVKRVGWKIPVGKRKYDKEPIGSDIEGRRK